MLYLAAWRRTGTVECPVVGGSHHELLQMQICRAGDGESLEVIDLSGTAF